MITTLLSSVLFTEFLIVANLAFCKKDNSVVPKFTYIDEEIYLNATLAGNVLYQADELLRVVFPIYYGSSLADHKRDGTIPITASNKSCGASRCLSCALISGLNVTFY